MGIIDDYFDGYYSEEMIESQVTFPMTPFTFSRFLYLCFFLKENINEVEEITQLPMGI